MKRHFLSIVASCVLLLAVATSASAAGFALYEWSLAAGTTFRTETGRNRVVIGKDTRLSGYVFENALTAGFCAAGMDVYLVGPMATPAIAFLTRNMRATMGVVISASHNPYQDNGIKFFDSCGYKLADSVEDTITDLVLNADHQWDYPILLLGNA